MTRKGGVTPKRYVALGQRLRAARERAGLSRAAVAREVVPGAKRERQTVYEWEAGTATPSVAQLSELCRLYRVSADVLLGLPTGEAATRLRIVGKVTEGRMGEALIQLLPTLHPALPEDVAQAAQDAALQWERDQAGQGDATDEGRG